MKMIQKISFGLSAVTIAATMLITPAFAYDPSLPSGGFVAPGTAQPAGALSTDANAALTQSGNQAGITTSVTLPQLIGRIINIILSLLGVIILALMVYGGYEWMTAQGDDKQVKTAKDILKNAIIGLIIIVAAYAISNYVVTAVFTAVGA